MVGRVSSVEVQNLAVVNLKVLQMGIIEQVVKLLVKLHY